MARHLHDPGLFFVPSCRGLGHGWVVLDANTPPGDVRQGRGWRRRLRCPGPVDRGRGLRIGDFDVPRWLCRELALVFGGGPGRGGRADGVLCYSVRGLHLFGRGRDYHRIGQRSGVRTVGLGLSRVPHRWAGLAAINLGNFVTPLDTGIMALILPTIAYNIRAPVSIVLWVPLSSLLIGAGFMPVFGRLSDRSGRRKYFVVGLVLFAVGAILAGNSLTIYELLVYRVIQSFGGAFVLANGRAMIADLFEEKRRGFA